MKKGLIITIAKLLFALPMIVFGLNKFLGFIPFPPPEGELAQIFMGAMFTSYLFKLVASTQIIGGILTLIPRTSFIGILMLLPVVANIVAYHIAHDMPGNGIWIFTLIITGIVIYFYKEKFKTLMV